MSTLRGVLMELGKEEMANDERRLTHILRPMSTLVLNLDDQLARRLASAAARSHKALPEWAAEQLGHLADAAEETPTTSPARDRMNAALGNLTGIWKGRGTTDDLMKLTRGED